MQVLDTLLSIVQKHTSDELFQTIFEEFVYSQVSSDITSSKNEESESRNSDRAKSRTSSIKEIFFGNRINEMEIVKTLIEEYSISTNDAKYISKILKLVNKLSRTNIKYEYDLLVNDFDTMISGMSNDIYNIWTDIVDKYSDEIVLNDEDANYEYANYEYASSDRIEEAVNIIMSTLGYITAKDLKIFLRESGYYATQSYAVKLLADLAQNEQWDWEIIKHSNKNYYFKYTIRFEKPSSEDVDETIQLLLTTYGCVSTSTLKRSLQADDFYVTEKDCQQFIDERRDLLAFTTSSSVNETIYYANAPKLESSNDNDFSVIHFKINGK